MYEDKQQLIDRLMREYNEYSALELLELLDEILSEMSTSDLTAMVEDLEHKN